LPFFCPQSMQAGSDALLATAQGGPAVATGAASIGTMPIVRAAAASAAAIFLMEIFFADQPLVLRPAGDCAAGNVLRKRLAPLAVDTEGIPGVASWDGVRHLRGAVSGEAAAMAATAALIAFLMMSLTFVVRGARSAGWHGFAGGRASSRITGIAGVSWTHRAGMDAAEARTMICAIKMLVAC
jgi:hypothetical protein